ncbi:MAG TPA: type IV toxin-antitoxin system AbiEi family antitoxin domain-containing protein [Actinomycetota bacterium]|nr:type IV toxin-antitoxin system AbiEi family antitoxin domain-containing protein [Actinomycetota bacterium]
MGVPDDRCATLAAEQQGCISWRQALACGLSPEGVSRRARNGRWRRVLPQVYVICGAPSTWEQRLFAAVLWGGDSAVLSAGSAATLWGFPRFRRGPVEIAHPGSRRSRREVVVHRTRLPEGDVTNLDGFPVTTAARTLADVAGRLEPESFDAAFHHCLHARLTDLPTLAAVSARHAGAGHPGAALLREALRAYSGGRASASPLEVRCARLLARSKLPAPTRQLEVRAAGKRRFLDFAWPEARVALEVDGYRWHSSRAAWESDRARARELRRAGWAVIQVTHDDLAHGFDRIADEIAALLAR